MFQNKIYLHNYKSPCGDIILGSFDNKICLCDWVNGKNNNTTKEKIISTLKADCRNESNDIIKRAAEQLNEYFNKRRKAFDIPLLFIGTEFQKKAWTCLLNIPYGRTISYSMQAKMINRPNSVRAVAHANSLNAISIFAPCHRVIAANKTLAGYGGGLETKKFLLNLEGVTLF